ncbi:unnamed protein product [Symbiodinium necroappetens]|uniref:F-box domain-containing protein n=1 Tax=Symbiodinium necroappetens TaxID=1628268 RepID=A0A812SGQ8_9DINO|nr:unnamed protein product [Symbiodinium necroappetens]
MPSVPVPLDVLCNCLAFSSLSDRLRCAVTSRRWQEAVLEPCLWASLAPEPEDLLFLSCLLKRFGASVRCLRIAGHGPNRLGSNSLSFPQLAKCINLEKLCLSGFRGRDLEHFCQSKCQMPALRSLVIECDPYFNLGSFSHNTGAHMASLPISWLACFPNLERLVCDYLKVEASDIDAEACDETTDSEDEVVWLDRNVELDVPDTTARRAADSAENSVANSAAGTASSQGHAEVVANAAEAAGPSDASTASRRLPVPVPLELPLAALSPRGREEAQGSGSQPGPQRQSRGTSGSGSLGEELLPLQKLRDLSFVAVVRGSGSTWHSAHCRCDLSVLARLAPGLERLSVRSPNIALGRMSRRPGQRIEGLIRVSRHFCSTGLRDLLAVGYLLPSLRCLKVEVAKDDTGNSWDSSGSLLTVPASSKQLSHASHLALLLAVQDRPFFLSVGTSEALAAKLRRASSATASPAAVSVFQNFAIAEQHLPLLQCLQKFQEPKDQKESKDSQLQEFEVDIVEAA